MGPGKGRQARPVSRFIAAASLLWYKAVYDQHREAGLWLTSAEEDWDVAVSLVQQGRIRHGLFFAHLALEKTLKAHICRFSGELAPPVHNLVRLAEKASLNLSPEMTDLLAEVNEFNIEGRYPELLLPLPSREEAAIYLERINEVLLCLQNRF